MHKSASSGVPQGFYCDLEELVVLLTAYDSVIASLVEQYQKIRSHAELIYTKEWKSPLSSLHEQKFSLWSKNFETIIADLSCLYNVLSKAVQDFSAYDQSSMQVS